MKDFFKFHLWYSAEDLGYYETLVSLKNLKSLNIRLPSPNRRSVSRCKCTCLGKVVNAAMRLEGVNAKFFLHKFNFHIKCQYAHNIEL